ncbi:YesN/AraC family two-component response regulator [Enterococcus sp. PF1-24]|uniref:AraC family transcriptional regulator n=1 Tax=unclassified Enterococcus TaxID=2608891 RepID=UPI002476947F|nr:MULTISPECIES: AraC family transcriptional regulator [unclassified Enterococcus]MDH6364358.1 YesN/AraC family two-component response regulator [Enterococcus sp. PFB1-1]MDH6401453.1 YesN/AraC family two-component response regulator [Enterococcus sp. PF1-24]
MEYWENANHSWSPDSTRFISTPTQKSRDLFYYSQEIGHFKANQPYFTERANLPSYLMKFTLSGKGQLIYEEKRHVITAGDVFFIDCQNYQHYKTVSAEPWEMDWIHFNGGQAEAFYQEINKNGNPVFHTDSEKIYTNQIHLIMNKLLQLQGLPNAKTEFQTSLLIHELLNELLLQKYQMDFQDSEIPDYILVVKAILDDEFRKGVTLEALTSQFHLNKYQIVKDFSKYMGIPPIEYQINQKISFAKDLLRYTKMSIKEVALEIGIENFAYFSRLFKKKTGLTPSEYRKIDAVHH